MPNRTYPRIKTGFPGVFYRETEAGRVFYILYRHEGERRLIEDRLIGKGWTEARAAAERIRRIEGKASNALNRVTGSIAFIAAARAPSKDPDNPDRRLMIPLKNNLAKDTHGFGYRVEERNLSGIPTSCVSWEDEPVNLSAEEVLSAQGRPDNRGGAEDFLLQELAEGAEVPCKELYERAEAKGIRRKVLWNSKVKMGVKARKDGFKGGWVWFLPFEAPLKITNLRRFPKIP